VEENQLEFCQPSDQSLRLQIIQVRDNKGQVTKLAEALALYDIVENLREIAERKKSGKEKAASTDELYERSIKGTQIMKVLGGQADLHINLNQNVISKEEILKFVEEQDGTGDNDSVDAGCPPIPDGHEDSEKASEDVS